MRDENPKDSVKPHPQRWMGEKKGISSLKPFSSYNMECFHLVEVFYTLIVFTGLSKDYCGYCILRLSNEFGTKSPDTAS